MKSLIIIHFLLLLLVSCGPESDPAEQTQAKVQFTDSHTFTNENEADPDADVQVNDLHIIFKKADITVLSLGPFDKSEAVDRGEGNSRHTEIDISMDGSIAPGDKAKLSFQSKKTADFAIDKWWWTDLGTRVGQEHQGDPQ